MSTSTEDTSDVRRRFFAPEAIQTSSMDCGPATLKTLLSGFGIKTSYGRLREACHTSVDGTSIDTLEELTNALGLQADQEMVPVEHVLAPEVSCLPALVVTRLPSGLTHFVVVWRTVGPWVQIMDPGRGRRWLKRASLERDLYVHESEVPTADVAEWLLSSAFIAPLRSGLRKVLGGTKAEELVDQASHAGWQRIAALDAVLRTARRLVEQKVVEPGRLHDVFDALLRSTEGNDPRALIPDGLWTVRPVVEGNEEAVIVRGAVALEVKGKGEVAADLSPELSAAIHMHETGAGRQLFELLRADGLWRLLPIFAGLAVAGVGSVVETLLFRGAFDISQRLAVFEQRLFAAFALLFLLCAMVLIEWPVARALWGAGCRLEMRLRRSFLRKLPRLGDRYFQSRPISSMAESSHLLHWVRLLPGHSGQVVRTLCELCATVAGVVWLHPPSAPLILLLAVLMIALPLLGQPILLERDMRMRGHNGGLARFYLDALLGLSAIRAHTAEGAVAAEHGSRLREWGRAARDLARTQILIETLLGLVGFGLAAVVVFHYLMTAEGSGWAILLVYWVLMVPSLGLELAFLIQQYPQHRNVTSRLLEPLGAEEHASDEASDEAPDASSADDPVDAHAPTIQLERGSVEQAGNQVLSVESLTIPAGQHVAIVGVSGAGKSSLVGLLLGWYPPSDGVVRVDGEPLVGVALARLRRTTTWVDPTVQLWNRTLLDNLRYGREDERQTIGEAVEEAELGEVLARLPMGLQTSVGAGGALLSGGEGQRLRLGRGICRGKPSLVILDEAFCGLERLRRFAMLAAARKRWKNATLLCITHDIAQTKDFDRVLVLEGGRLVEDGVPESLAAQAESRYAQLLESEARTLARLSGPEWRRFRVEAGHVFQERGGSSRES